MVHRVVAALSVSTELKQSFDNLHLGFWLGLRWRWLAINRYSPIDNSKISEMSARDHIFSKNAVNALNSGVVYLRRFDCK